jgi:hypothetical protein
LLRRTALAAALLAPLLLVASPTSVARAAAYDEPPEDYASYQPQTTCRKSARPGTVELAAWIDARFDGGTASASMRPCDSGGTSEHKDGRAIDWSMNAARKQDRHEVAAFLERLFAADADGNAHALARRMGVMYVIWDDHMYASYDGFEPREYRSSSCTSLKRCSPTLRHRDHVHISLSRPGGRGATSWYATHGPALHRVAAARRCTARTCGPSPIG